MENPKVIPELQIICTLNKGKEIVILSNIMITDKNALFRINTSEGKQRTFHELSINEAIKLQRNLTKTIREAKKNKYSK